MVQKSILITKREAEVINKRLQNRKLTQQDSNYLSRYVRPKLREMAHIDSRLLLSRLEYNRKIPSIERYIKDLILKNIKYVSSITVYGSAVYNNYRDYNDIDVLVTVRRKTWKRLGEKLLLARKIQKKSKLKLDIKIYTDEYVYYSYPNNIVLIYGLKDSKTIYGLLRHKKNIEIKKLYLKMHSDYSEMILDNVKEDGISSVSAKDLYSAIRNMAIIKLIMKKTVDNIQLNQILENELGKNIIKRLKNNSKSTVVKEIAYLYLKDLYNSTIKLINSLKEEIKWGKGNR
ncbi:nucleotidyltransferase domain-containing protein [Candidatus Woesearchaeota archaeon]|nr:nucleotidyltransferase domain-containing protein [Candidatus Woesearchaeota archaeon]